MDHPKGEPHQDVPELAEPGTVKPSKSMLIIICTLVLVAALAIAALQLYAAHSNDNQTYIISKKPEINSNLTGNATADSLSVSGDFNLGGHFSPSGTAPDVRLSTAARGGVSSIVGNDTAGTVTVTVGGNSRAAGEMAVITFHTPFPLTPKVQLTAVNADTANLPFFVIRSASFFSINSAAPLTADKTYVFDYLVTQ